MGGCKSAVGADTYGNDNDDDDDDDNDAYTISTEGQSRVTTAHDLRLRIGHRGLGLANHETHLGAIPDASAWQEHAPVFF